MITLTTLGTLRLDKDGSPVTGAAAQRRRLVLLAILAASPRGMSRESLAALLWGEHDEERARHSLEQALYGLKRSLGPDPVQRTSTALILDATVVRADVAAFDRAVAEDDWDAAAKLYSGSFLEGVFLDDASDFERWSERERGRRREAYCRALENCARAAQLRQAPAEAVHWWRRLHEENPLSTRTTVSLAQALEAAGERDDALRIAEAFATRGEGTQRDLAPQLAELLTRLRGGSRATVPPSASGSGAAGDVLAVELADALGAAYRIEGRISRSRMYQVFRARQAQSGRVSVIKVLEPSIVRYGDRRTLVDHLERATALVHDHIAGFDTVGTTAHLVYLVGPDDEGETLRDRVRQRGELSVNEALTVARQVGNALAHAHTAGVLHLDVTPKRILLTARKAALRDTGLASALRAATAAGGQSIDETGVLLGTAAFMSPELVRAEGTPNERTDLFSLAATVFYALTGVLPFGAAGIGAQPRPAAPSAAAIRSTVPRNVDAALSRALSPLRSDRHASVREFLNELEPS